MFEYIQVFLYWFGITLMLSGVILFLSGVGSFGSSGTKDKRTTTGYKDNEVPDPGNPGKGCLFIIIAPFLIIGGYFSFVEGGGMSFDEILNFRFVN